MSAAPLIRDQINRSLEAVFTQAGLKVKSVGLQFRSDGKVLTATGWHADGTPFATASKPFHEDPTQFAQSVVRGLIAAHNGEAPQESAPAAAPERNSMGTGQATDLANRIRAIRERHSNRMAQIEQDHGARVTDIGARGDAALDKLETALANQAAADEAQVKALEDEVNQLTNGGPA